MFRGSVVLCDRWGHAEGGRRELCLMLCPDRDTRLDVSAKYLWVQCEFNVSVVQWFSGSDEVSTTK